MAVETQDQLRTRITRDVADNTSGDISAQDIRTIMRNIVDSVVFAAVGGHTRYGALGADATFIAGDFTGSSGFNSDTNTITVPSFTGNMYLAFAIRDDIADPTDIREEGSAFNSFSLFAKQTAQIDIGGDMYNVWISNAAIFPYTTDTNWVIT